MQEIESTRVMPFTWKLCEVSLLNEDKMLTLFFFFILWVKIDDVSKEEIFEESLLLKSISSVLRSLASKCIFIKTRQKVTEKMTYDRLYHMSLDASRNPSYFVLDSSNLCWKNQFQK